MTMKISEALKKWCEKHPESPVTIQTMRNWSREFGFATEAKPALAHSQLAVDEAKFKDFLKNSDKKFEAREKKPGRPRKG